MPARHHGGAGRLTLRCGALLVGRGVGLELLGEGQARVQRPLRQVESGRRAAEYRWPEWLTTTVFAHPHEERPETQSARSMRTAPHRFSVRSPRSHWSSSTRAPRILLPEAYARTAAACP